MRRFFIAALFLLLAVPSFATWTKVQDVIKGSVNCQTTCTITVASTGANNLAIVGIMLPNNTTTISSVTDNATGGSSTWSLCAASACHGTDSTTKGTDFAFTTALKSGATTITITVSSSTTACLPYFAEYSTTSGPPVLDTQNVRDQSSGTANPAGVTLTLAGSTEVVVQEGKGGANITAVSGTYTNPADFSTTSGFAGSINTSSGTAPTWTMSASTACFSAIAFKESAASTAVTQVGAFVVGP